MTASDSSHEAPRSNHPPEATAATVHRNNAGNQRGRLRWWALGFVLAGNLAVFAAVTMMNVALPEAQNELDMSSQDRQWVLTLYSLCFGAFMLLGGRLADVLGLRRCLSTGLIGFALASLIGGLATTPAVLLIGRALQGLTGTLVAASALALISVMFTQGRDGHVPSPCSASSWVWAPRPPSP